MIIYDVGNKKSVLLDSYLEDELRQLEDERRR